MTSKLILINGSRCSGKSLLSKELYKSLDKTILINLDSIKWLYSSYDKENSYSLQLAKKVSLKMVEEYIKEGLNIIIERAFNFYEYIKPYVDLKNKVDVEIILINIEAPLKVLLERNKSRVHITPKENRITKIETIRKSFEHYNNNKFIVDLTYDTSKLDIETIVKDIKKNIFS
jgi:predicted kinase